MPRRQPRAQPERLTVAAIRWRFAIAIMLTVAGFVLGVAALKLT
jgi:hypothetical protein